MLSSCSTLSSCSLLWKFSAQKKFIVPNYKHIPQTVAREFMPKGGYIWRVRQVDGWSSRFKKMASKGFKEADFDGHGLDKSDCPVQGLFESD